jgi:hypothetical protein
MDDNRMHISQYPRRRFLQTIAAAPFGIACATFFNACNANKLKAEAFIAKAANYSIEPACSYQASAN